jgi:hypothetical protein
MAVSWMSCRSWLCKGFYFAKGKNLTGGIRPDIEIHSAVPTFSISCRDRLIDSFLDETFPPSNYRRAAECAHGLPHHSHWLPTPASVPRYAGGTGQGTPCTARCSCMQAAGFDNGPITTASIHSPPSFPQSAP